MHRTPAVNFRTTALPLHFFGSRTSGGEANGGGRTTFGNDLIWRLFALADVCPHCVCVDYLKRIPMCVRVCIPNAKLVDCLLHFAREMQVGWAFCGAQNSTNRLFPSMRRRSLYQLQIMRRSCVRTIFQIIFFRFSGENSDIYGLVSGPWPQFNGL